MSADIERLREYVTERDESMQYTVFSPGVAIKLLDRLEAAERERVPRFKFESLVQHCARLEQGVAQLQSDLRALNYGDMSNVWYWQGGGDDCLESLTCPVVIPAPTLRDLIKGQAKEPSND